MIVAERISCNLLPTRRTVFGPDRDGQVSSAVDNIERGLRQLGAVAAEIVGGEEGADRGLVEQLGAEAGEGRRLNRAVRKVRQDVLDAVRAGVLESACVRQSRRLFAQRTVAKVWTAGLLRKPA